MDNNDYKKLLDKISKMARSGEYDLENMISRSGNLVSDTQKYRNLMEDSAANELLKSTGVASPNKMNSSSIEQFIRDLSKENYGTDFDTNIRVVDDLNSLGEFDPNIKTISIKRNPDLKKMVSTGMHELGHAYDLDTDRYGSIELKEKSLDKDKQLSKLGNNKSEWSKAKIDQLGEAIQTDHHAWQPERKKSFGRSALENLVKGNKFRSLALPASVGAGLALMSGDVEAATEAAVDSVLPIGMEPTSLGPSKGSAAHKLESGTPLTEQDMTELGFTEEEKSKEINRQNKR